MFLSSVSLEFVFLFCQACAGDGVDRRTRVLLDDDVIALGFGFCVFAFTYLVLPFVVPKVHVVVDCVNVVFLLFPLSCCIIVVFWVWWG